MRSLCAARPSSSMEEQWTFNPLVQGSSPWGGTWSERSSAVVRCSSGCRTCARRPCVVYAVDSASSATSPVVTATLHDGFTWGHLPNGWRQDEATTATFLPARTTPTPTPDPLAHTGATTVVQQSVVATGALLVGFVLWLLGRRRATLSLRPPTARSVCHRYGCPMAGLDKVAIVGAGSVGAAIAYASVIGRLADEIALFDVDGAGPCRGARPAPRSAVRRRRTRLRWR